MANSILTSKNAANKVETPTLDPLATVTVVIFQIPGSGELKATVDCSQLDHISLIEALDAAKCALARYAERQV